MIKKAHTKSRRSLKAAVGLGAAVASLAFAGVASAAVTVVTPDEPNGASCPFSASSSHLTTAIQNATASTNTLILQPGVYCPVTPGGVPIPITHNLSIVADHSYQATGNLPNIQIQGLDGTSATLFTIGSGTTLTLEAMDWNLGGQAGGTVISNSGTLNAYGVTWDGDYVISITNATSSSVSNLTDSTISDGLGDGFVNSGTATFKNVSFLNNTGHALDINPGSHTYAYNTLFGNNSASCYGGTFTNGGTANGDLTDDSSCGAQYSGVSNIDNYLAGNGTSPYGNDATNGGPTTTTDVGDPGDIGLKGNPTYCPTTDQRFFVNPVISGQINCDIGSVTDETDITSGTPVTAPNSATQQTTPAISCGVTGGVPGVSQQVTLSDSKSGIGPEIGLETDNPSNTPYTTYNPMGSPLAVPGYDVDNLQITNGSVSFTSPTQPTLGGVVLTAGNKTTPGINNSQWSFTALDWAGLSKFCA